MPIDTCPDCGNERTAGLCLRCVLKLGLNAPRSESGRDWTIDHLPRPGSVLATIAGTLGGVPRVLLRGTDFGEASSPIVRPLPESDATLRYRIDGEIARGGMGAILKGRDPDLGRDVAIKVLLEGHGDNADMVRRFVEEAQIGGQLQHPGVVPIYELGTFADKRPFFSMKLVKGQTLADLLAARSGPAVDLARYLSIFEAIAQTMAYTHTRGVIHRDLKPSNVMVGSFGEVQVMDWGLAKVLARGGVVNDAKAGKEKPLEPLIATARSEGDTDHSLAGSVMGTPSYMAPEQARGETDRLDERADVFALGSILCEVLTGAPAFTGHTSGEILRKASKGDAADALTRLGGCGAESDLVALARDCLAAEPEDRPHNANLVAERVTAYLAGVQERVQAAERDRAVAVAREAEQRKRRRVQVALAAALVGLLLGGGGFAWWRDAQARAGRERDARNAEAVTVLLGQCAEALRASDAARAQIALEAARKRSAEGGAQEQARWLGRLDADLDLLRELDDIDRFRWTIVGDQLPDREAVATRTRKALGRIEADPTVAPADDSAARVSASVVRERIVAALDRLLRPKEAAGARAVLRRVDADPYRDAVRDAILRDEPAKIAELAGRGAALEQPPGFVTFLGESQAIHMGRRRQLLEAAVVRRPGDLGLLMTLGHTYPPDQADGADERLRWYQAAVAAAPGNAAAVNNLGVALSRTGRSDEAIACLEKAIALEPKSANAQNNLGNALKDKGRSDEAIARYHEAIALEPKHAEARFNLGHALHGKGRLDEAITLYEKAIELDPEHAKAHNTLGNALKVKGRLGEAIARYHKSIALDPKNALFHTNLGVALGDAGQIDEALACFEKAIALDANLASAYYNLGSAMAHKGRWDEAIVRYHKAIALDPSHAESHCNLGGALASQGRFAEALAPYKRGHELGTKRPGWRYPSAGWVRQAEVNATIEAKLPAFLKGDFQPKDNEERMALVDVSRAKKLHQTATALYAVAFAADPKLGNDRQVQHRYNAACHASLAASGQGKDEFRPNESAKAKLREQSLDWLKAELAAWRKVAMVVEPGNKELVVKVLTHWRQDADLDAVREEKELAKLSEAERDAWKALWADVAALLKRVEKPASGTAGRLGRGSAAEPEERVGMPGLSINPLRCPSPRWRMTKGVV